MIILCEIIAKNKATGAEQVFRYSSGKQKPIFDGHLWRARLKDTLTLGMGIFSDEFQSAGAERTVGQIEIIIADGELDDFVNYDFLYQNIKIWTGQQDQEFNDFKLVFHGLIESNLFSEMTMRLKLGDLSNSLEEDLKIPNYSGTGTYGGNEDLKGHNMPMAWGECFNIEPVLIDTVNLIYQCHFRQIESIDSVYDKGAAITYDGDTSDLTSWVAIAGKFKTDLSRGLFKLGAKPVGLITADIKGDSVGGYVNSADQIIKRVFNLSQKSALLNIDDISFSALHAANSNRLGFFSKKLQKTSDIFSHIMRSLGGFWHVDWKGNLKLDIFDFKNSSGDITERHLIELEKSEDRPPVWKLSNHYSPNWRQQSLSEIAQGSTGAKWFRESGIPAASLGEVGDFYINTVTNKYYEKTSENTWAEAGDLKGDAGNTGAVGNTGSKGDAGDTGAVGNTGSKGDAGDTGAVGNTGSKGDAGDTGAVGNTGSKGDAGDTGADGVGQFTLKSTSPTSQIKVTKNTVEYVRATGMSWSPFAYTEETLEGDFEARFVCEKTSNQYLSVGLTPTPSVWKSPSLHTFALWLSNNGNVYVYYDSGSKSKFLTSFSNGDEFIFKRVSGKINIYKKGILEPLFTSNDSFNEALGLQFNLASPSSKIKNIFFSKIGSKGDEGRGGLLNKGTDDLDNWSRYHNSYTPPPDTTIEDDAGVRAIRSGGTDGRDIYSAEYIKIDPTKNYRVRCKIRSTGANKKNYALVGVYNSNKQRISPASSTGWNGGIGTFYYYYQNGNTPQIWTEIEVYFGPDFPAKLPTGTEYIKLGWLTNYQGYGTGDTLIKDLELREVDPRQFLALRKNGGIVNQKILGANQVVGMRSAANIYPGAATHNSITILTFTAQFGSGTVTYIGGVIYGTSPKTKYHVYCDDPDMKGGAVIWKATTDIQVACDRMERFKVFTYTTPDAAGDGGGAGSGTGNPDDNPTDDCVAVDQYINEGFAGDALVGDKILIMDDNNPDYFLGEIDAIRFSDALCVELKTISGIKLICSRTTPISLRYGVGTAYAPFMKGLEVAVLDYGDFRWEEVISVAEIIKPRAVARISVGGRSYAAGSAKDRLIFTHNILKP